MKFLITFFLVGTLISGASNAQAPATFNILSYGAVADGKTVNTPTIQKAIDEAAAVRGTLVIPTGTYVTGTLYMRNNVTIILQKGAVLLGSDDFKDYPVNQVSSKNIFTNSNNGASKNNRALLFADGIENINISGEGAINGHGDSKTFDLGDDGASAMSKDRPCLILFVNSKKIELKNLFLTKSAYWMQLYQNCDNVHIDGVTVYNHSNYNEDGIDIDSKNVLIENCVIDCDDDGICLKSHDRNNICENVVVRNCQIASNCNPIKFGTSSIGGFRNINVTNCIVKGASADKIRHWQSNLQFIDQPITGLAGLALENVDGGVMENISISNIKMTDMQTPVFVVLGNRARKGVGETDAPPVGIIRNITIENIIATGHSKMTSSVTALPGHYLENIILRNIMINNSGGGTVREGQAILPENPNSYPENRMYGNVYPASGLFIRHVKNILLSNIKLNTRMPDARPVVVMDDVKGASFTQMEAQYPVQRTPLIKLVNVQKAVFTDPVIHVPGAPFLLLDGANTDQINLHGFRDVDGEIIVGQSVRKNSFKTN